MDNGGHILLIATSGAGRQRAREGDVLKLATSFSLVEGCVSHHHESTLVGRFYDSDFAASQITKGQESDTSANVQKVNDYLELGRI